MSALFLSLFVLNMSPFVLKMSFTRQNSLSHAKRLNLRFFILNLRRFISRSAEIGLR